jgi:D-serine deaminase-like pyridoxal phosphate-dependent protein
LTKDAPPYLEGHGFVPAYPEAVIERLSDYHGEVRLAGGDSSHRPVLGDVLAIVPNHACPVIDLFDSFIATRDGEILGCWPIDARGRS